MWAKVLQPSWLQKTQNIIKHSGGSVNNSVDEEYESILKQKIFATKVELDNDKEFQNIVQINKRNIEDKVVDRKMYMN